MNLSRLALGRSFQYTNAWEDSQGKILYNDTTESIPSSSTTANVWYHIKIDYDKDTKTIDFSSTFKSDNSVYHEVNNLDASALSSFDQIFIGGWQKGPKYGDYGEIRVDNILLIHYMS